MMEGANLYKTWVIILMYIAALPSRLHFSS